jgi:hypothetical protein
VDSVQITVLFNPTILAPLDIPPNDLAIKKTPLSNPLTLTQNVLTPGRAKAVLFGVNPISGSGNLITIRFQVIGTLGESTPLNITEALYNEYTVTSVLDDGLFAVCTSTDADADEQSTCAGDCNDANAAVYRGAPEVCDGIDNQCPGDSGWAQTDEGVQITFYRDADEDGFGVASDTALACSAPPGYVATAGDCNDANLAVHPGAPEVCNAVDDDCDGPIDENLGQTTCGIGACQRSFDNCVGGAPQTCIPGDPVAELCDGLDNDCDGAMDDGLGQTTCGIGTCERTVDNCTGGLPQTCIPGDPVAEQCDGLDNDCDGAMDDGLGQTTCGIGECERTVDNCTVGLPQTCIPGDPVAELCDGLDDDCDGAVDDGLGQTTCGIGTCERTVDNCTGGLPQTCVPGEPVAELCDGLDNDCDGAMDDGLGQTTCGIGECERTVDNCVGGVPQTCIPGDPVAELCDGLDNDCDGALPESELDADSDGYRPCAGDCDDGNASTHPGGYEECDSVDSNCDGSYTDASCDDADTCTIETCASTGPTFAECSYDYSGACTVSGRVAYYRDSTDPYGAADGSDKGVPGVDLSLTGYRSATVATANPDGTYFTPAGGDVTLAPQPVLGLFTPPDDPGVPGVDCFQIAITGLDAAAISRHVVLSQLLSAGQQVAADVSGDATISSWDASLVAQFVVRLISRFPVAQSAGSDWAFVPSSETRSVRNASSPGVSFTGIFYGDVSGNWGELCPFESVKAEGAASADDATATRAHASGPSAFGSSGGGGGRGGGAPPASVEIFAASTPVQVSADEWEVTLGVQGGSGVLGLDLEILHDGTILDMTDARPVDAAAHFALNRNAVEGRFLLSCYAAAPMRDTGRFLVLRLRSREGSVLEHISLRVRANEGRIAVRYGAGLSAPR